MATRYPVSDQAIEKADLAFEHHEVSPDQFERLNETRKKCRELAETVLLCCPPGREQALAMTKLEEVMFWANAGISRG